jgi:hypothetical protein
MRGMVTAFIVLSVLISASVIGSAVDPLGLRYAVSFTTIPPRSKHIHHTVRSWLQQSIPPQKIIVFVPAVYKRFRPKAKQDTEQSRAAAPAELTNILYAAFPTEIDSRLIEIITLTADWGPMTKFIGSLAYQQFEFLSGPNPILTLDYWMFCDDDVRYREDVARYYAQQIELISQQRVLSRTQRAEDAATEASPSIEGPPVDPRYHSLGYTLFAAEKRLHFSLSHESSDREVSHIQGVDSYLIPISAFDIPESDASSIGANGLLTTKGGTVLPGKRALANVTNMARIVEHYYTSICPDSFYQDDYMVSFLLNLAGIDMLSIRNPCAYGLITPAQAATTLDENGVDVCKSGLNLVGPIPGVTKEHFQMHLKEEVFRRETITQRCLMETANDAYIAMLEGA